MMHVSITLVLTAVALGAGVSMALLTKPRSSFMRICHVISLALLIITVPAILYSSRVAISRYLVENVTMYNLMCKGNGSV